MNKTILTFLFLTMFLVSACSTDEPANGTETSDTPPTEISTRRNAGKKDDGKPAGPMVLGSLDAREVCYETNTGDNVIQKEHTFALDFEPFKDACFVTAHNPEHDDPPMEAVTAIYKDNKKIADLPSQFNGNDFGCWVTGVAFLDLNGDELADIVVAGKCTARAEEINENVIYINDGKGFTTDAERNQKLNKLTATRAIANFVTNKENKFFE